jgi:hypothetical protein
MLSMSSSDKRGSAIYWECDWECDRWVKVRCGRGTIARVDCGVEEVVRQSVTENWSRKQMDKHAATWLCKSEEVPRQCRGATSVAGAGSIVVLGDSHRHVSGSQFRAFCPGAWTRLIRARKLCDK